MIGACASECDDCVAALLYGKRDFENRFVWPTGFVTDCNGAIAGSILGAALGLERIPPYWYQTFNNRLQTTIFGVETVISVPHCQTLRY